MEYYDQARMQTPQTEAAVLSMLAAELAGRGRCLEIGVGTGRVSLPLHDQGIALAGVDISAGMVSRLVAKAGGRPPFPLALADATALPFRSASLGAGLASHVFHLIPPWRGAVAELVRVVRPGGVILVSLRGAPLEVFGEIGRRFSEAAGFSRDAVGAKDSAELDQAFIAAGTTVRDLPSVTEQRDVAPEEIIGRLERGEFSYTWDTPQEVRQRAAATIRQWALAEYGSLTRPRPTQRQVVWRAYDLPT